MDEVPLVLVDQLAGVEAEPQSSNRAVADDERDGAHRQRPRLHPSQLGEPAVALLPRLDPHRLAGAKCQCGRQRGIDAFCAQLANQLLAIADGAGNGDVLAVDCGHEHAATGGTKRCYALGDHSRRHVLRSPRPRQRSCHPLQPSGAVADALRERQPAYLVDQHILERRNLRQLDQSHLAGRRRDGPHAAADPTQEHQDKTDGN